MMGKLNNVYLPSPPGFVQESIDNNSVYLLRKCLSGGEGAHNMIQQMGRGLRTADDKDKLDYHDFHFLTNKYLNDHSEWRMEVLSNEGHEVIVKDKVEF